jgi:hypothetical protein
VLPTHPLPKKLLLFRFQPSPYTKVRQVGAKEEFLLFAVSIARFSDTQGNSKIYILTKYQEYTDVFDKAKASVLPKFQPYDCPIDLQPGKEPPRGH